MKKRVILVLIILPLMITSNLYSQNMDEVSSNTTQSDALKPEISKLAPLLNMHEFENYSVQPSLHFLNDFQFLKQKEVILGFEFGRSLLENKFQSSFRTDFRPRTVSEYNYAAERYRIEGEIPLRRTGWSNFRFLFD